MNEVSNNGTLLTVNGAVLVSTRIIRGDVFIDNIDHSVTNGGTVSMRQLVVMQLASATVISTSGSTVSMRHINCRCSQLQPHNVIRWYNSY